MEAADGAETPGDGLGRQAFAGQAQGVAQGRAEQDPGEATLGLGEAQTAASATTRC